ncbi:TrkH family potassium uptake protein [bacterium]|nr:TrkH family potassium uptake protein [bacterium]
MRNSARRNRFETIHIVFNALASLFFLFSLIVLIPLVFVFLYREYQLGYHTLAAFLIPAVLSALVGLVLRANFHGGTINTLQAMLICSCAWIGFSAIGALPFVIGIGAGYVDGVFETMSGFTTTGITMFTGLDAMPKSILFWRSWTQWLGGLGILTFFLAVVNQGGGAHRLFGAESHKMDVGRPIPGLAHTITVLWLIYGLFTVSVIAGLRLAGMPLFDSLCHAFTALCPPAVFLPMMRASSITGCTGLFIIAPWNTF